MSDCTICGSEIHLESNCNSPDAVHDRALSIYEFLVDETENPMTLRSEDKNKMLHFLLETFEYLQGSEEENPVEEFFK